MAKFLAARGRAGRALSGFLAFALVLRVSVKGGSVKMPDLKGLTQQAAAVEAA